MTEEEQPVPLLNEKYPDLQNSREVGRAVLVQVGRGGDKPYTGPERIETYLDRLEAIIFNPDLEKRQRGEGLLRKLLLDKAIIEEDEIPEGYFENQQRLARERGQGDIDVTDEMKHEASEMIRIDQTASLDRWLDYIESDDARYPTWFKYFVTRNILTMSDYDKDKHSFGKRSRGTTKPYPDLNHEALAYVYDALSTQKAENNEPQDQELAKLLRGANFSKLYAYAIENITPASPEQLKDTDGRWVKFDQGSDSRALAESLQGHATGWCVAGEGVAEGYLGRGDFYVFYTKDQDGNYTIPRSAIATTDGEVTEVRGIAGNQNIEGSIQDIAREKYETLPGGDKFEKKDADMKRLTEIDEKVKQGQYLTKEDLHFLYEIEGYIEGFGYLPDPRIVEIIKDRNKIEDLNLILKDITHFEGNLNISGLTSAEGLILPHSIGDGLFLDRLTSAEGLILPQSIGGELNLSRLTSAEGLILPQSIGGGLDLSGLTSAEGLILPQSIRGSLYLGHLTSAEGLVLPQSIGKTLYFGRINSVEKEKLRQESPDISIF